MKQKTHLLGTIISGSLSDGFTMKIDARASLEQIKTGKFVSIIGNTHTFFSLITDLSLGVTNPDILLFPPRKEETLLLKILQQKDVYATAQLKLMLMIDEKKEPAPVKTIPAHFSLV